jgi:hypothetical protein
LEIGDIEKVFGTLKVDAKYEPDKKRKISHCFNSN